jgi:hypothetical protein
MSRHAGKFDSHALNEMVIPRNDSCDDHIGIVARRVCGSVAISERLASGSARLAQWRPLPDQNSRALVLLFRQLSRA